jgi:hypothetical protein
MGEDPDRRRAERSDRAAHHLEARARHRDRESEQAQTLVDRFVADAQAAGLPTDSLTARPWSGRGRYRTGLRGWYLRSDRSIAVGADGGYYVLTVPPVRLGRWRTVRVAPTPPPQRVGEGARDGESADLATLLQMRLGRR